MFQFFISVLLSVSVSSGTGNPSNCWDFRTGKFRIVDHELGLEYMIIRNEKTQSEINEKTGETTRYKVMWITDCTYRLKFLSGSKELRKHFKGKAVTVEILETYPAEYKFRALMEGVNFEVIHTAKRVE